MNDEMEIEVLTQCFSHVELARIYIVSLKERDRLVEELKQCKADLQAAIAGQETLQKACTVKHGRWKGMGMGDYYCSLCNRTYGGGNGFKFCPNCGARMDGE